MTKHSRISTPTLNHHKLREVVLYILSKHGKPLDAESLSVMLYFMDFDYYEKYEEHLIGATYLKDTND